MSRPARIAVVVAGSLWGLLALVMAGLAVYAHTDAFHARMQSAASRGIGMQVILTGPLHISFIPSPSLTFHDVQVRNRGVDVGQVEEVYVRYRWLPLLRQDPEVETVVVKRARVLIRKGTDGTLDLVRSTPPVHKRAHGSIEITATDIVIRYEDAKGRAWMEADGCDAKVHEVHTEAPDQRRVLERLSFSGADLECQTLSASKFTGTDLKLHGVAPGKGLYVLQPITLEAFGSRASGEFHGQFAGDQESYAAALSVPGVRISRVLDDMGFRRFADGRVDLAGNLAYQGVSHKYLLKSVTGDVSLHGSEITLQDYDLDKELTRFERTQRFDLTDVLGLFAVGGAGILATKGYDYADLIRKRRGDVSHIHVLVADLKVFQGMVHTQDVAMSTDTHRMAAQGKLDLSTGDFDHLTLALVDAKGCPIAENQLEGSIRKPTLKKPNVVRTLTGPVRRLANKAEDTFTTRGCHVFYDGSVKPY